MATRFADDTTNDSVDNPENFVDGSTLTYASDELDDGDKGYCDAQWSSGNESAGADIYVYLSAEELSDDWDVVIRVQYNGGEETFELDDFEDWNEYYVVTLDDNQVITDADVDIYNETDTDDLEANWHAIYAESLNVVAGNLYIPDANDITPLLYFHSQDGSAIDKTVWLKTGAGGYVQQGGTLPFSTTTYQLGSLAYETSYTAKIIYRNNDSSADSNERTWMLTPPAAVISAPLNNAYDVSVDTLLEWIPDANTDHLEVYLKTQAEYLNDDSTFDEDDLVLEDATGAEVSYDPAGLETGTNYVWTVIPYNSLNSAGPSSTWYFTTLFEVGNFTSPFNYVTRIRKKTHG